MYKMISSENFSSIKNIYLRTVLEILSDDLGSGFENFLVSIVEDDSLYLKIKTNYSTYKIEFSEKDGLHSQVISTGGSVFKTITISSGFIFGDKDKIKYFLRRQFVADEQLSNLYLKRGGIIMPHEAQENALINLSDTRKDGADRAIAILATGLGKTILSALDAKNMKAEKILFIVHVNEILRQTKESFQAVFSGREDDLGFYNGKQKEKEKKILFASIQTLGKRKHIENFSPDYFDYIIIDETHHTAAPTYNTIFSYFKPKFFLGLTATPDRMDRKDVLGFYNNNIVFEMNQEQAIEQGYLVPFQYLGFKDSIDYSDIYYNGFKYDTKDLNKHLLIDERDQAIIKKFKETVGERKTIGFCASIEHAERCALKFNEAGISAIAVHSQVVSSLEGESRDNELLIKNFREGGCQVAFVVDMFNEGVDIPDVSCLLFLRPTESKTIFIQHMGRGLRISPKKENVLILDFIGNYRTANTILDGLNIKGGIRGLSKVQKDGKDFFVYNLNGSEVLFDAEVVDIFKSNEALHIDGIKNDVISEEWREYSSYLERWTKDNLYWKRGQQNQYFEVNLEAVKIIGENPGLSETDFIEKIQKIVDEKYPNKNMTAGFRAIILSKISGLISSESPLKPAAPFYEICNRTDDFSELQKYQDVLTSQIEKILYWNPVYGSYNKYVDTSKRVSFKDFKIYPFFFIYDVLIQLVDSYGSDPYISRFEFNTFLAVVKEHSETKETVERILRFREDSERHQTQKLLEAKNNIDPRFYGIVHYNKYIEKDKSGIKLKSENIDEVRERVIKFKELYYSGDLILYTENAPELYADMLHSSKDILSYHNNER